MAVFLLGGSIVLELLLLRENRLRAQGKRDERVKGLTEKEKDALGDARPDFVYTL
jgi:hypothetical protein